MAAEKALKCWFSEEILPKLVTTKAFAEKNEKQEIEACKFENFQRGIHNFASIPSFARVDLRSAGKTISFHLFIKFQCQDPVVREKMKTDVQFRNEVAFYNEVAVEFSRFLSSSWTKNEKLFLDLIPTCYFAQYSASEPEKSIVVFKDLRKLGFVPSESRNDMDLNHCLVAVKGLAKFHAISFAMKYVNYEGFDRLKKSFESVWYADDAETRELCEQFKGLCAQRGIDYLMAQENSPVPRDYLNKIGNKLTPIFDYLKYLNSPNEPLSVICHGDFNRNNLLFRYEKGEPVDVKLIDFQTFIYASPCLDLSFFIYMNTVLEFRVRHFDEIFRLYYSILVETVGLIVNENEEKIRNFIPFDLFEKDFERVSLNSYVIASYFLPVMVAPNDEDFDETLKAKSYREMAEENYNQGGETVSKRIADIIYDFYSRKFFE